MRSILTPTFSTSKLKVMLPVMGGAIHDLITKIENLGPSQQQFDIYAIFQRLTLDVIGRTAFGIRANVQQTDDHPFVNAAKTVIPSSFPLLSILQLSLPEFGSILFTL